MLDKNGLWRTHALRTLLENVEQHLAASEAREDDALAELLPQVRMIVEKLEVAEEELVEQFQQSAEAKLLLEEERRRYRDLFELTPDGYLVTDAAGKIKEANRASAVVLNVPQVFLRGEIVFSFIAQKDRLSIRSEVERLIQAGSTRELEMRLQPRKGDPLQVSVRVAVSRDSDGNPIALLWLIRDITESKQGEEMLREGEERLASILESAMDAIITVDSDQRIVLFNAAAENIFGCAKIDAIGESLDLFIPHRFRVQHRNHIQVFSETNTTSRSMGALRTISGLRANGEEFPIEASISKVQAGPKRLFTVIIRDITSRMQDEDKLREQAALLDQAPDAILVRDLEDHILFWNKGAERIYGWTAEEAVGKHIRDLHYRELDDDFYEAKRILLARGDWSHEVGHVTRSGEKLVVENRWTLLRDRQGNPKSVLVINTDITEKKKMEAQFLRAQRMESIGTLAAGIAHDLGNILSPILLTIRLIRMNFENPEREKFLSIIERSAQRGAELLKQILGFARGVEGVPMLLQPKHIIDDVETVIKETFPKSVELKSYLSEGLWSIIADATQIHQVLMNICINARDAMEQGGQLTISAENIELDQVYATTSGGMQAGRYILIKVADTGTGIAAENMDKIFESFFTTKGPGKGTGLGLANVVEIIKRHAGFIDVESQVGKGTEFKLFLPAAEAEGIQMPEPDQPKLPVGRGEMILVVDDEATILEILSKMLEAYGYRVLTAADGVEAITVYAENRDEVDLVLLDMAMPSMDGPATIRALKKMNPGVKIIISSAYSESLDKVDDLGVKATLLKPYTAQKILSLLAGLLTRSKAFGGT